MVIIVSGPVTVEYSVTVSPNWSGGCSPGGGVAPGGGGGGNVPNPPLGSGGAPLEPILKGAEVA